MDSFINFLGIWFGILWFIFTICLMVVAMGGITWAFDDEEWGWFWGILLGYFCLVGPISWYFTVQIIQGW